MSSCSFFFISSSTLVILPYIYVLFDNLSVWARKVWRASEPAVAAAQAAEQS